MKHLRVGTVCLAFLGIGQLLDIKLHQRQQASATEYCLTETFRAECRGPNDVILMEHALFGRMELGRCVTKNYGHVGCSVDVLRYLDRLCSGKRSCQLTVSDPSLVRTKPCPVDFSSYLEASFRCVKKQQLLSVVEEISSLQRTSIVGKSVSSAIILPAASSAPGEDCLAARQPEIPYSLTWPTTSGFPDQAYAVSSICPISLIFHVQPGQRLNITLYDFGRSHQHSASDVTESASFQSQQHLAAAMTSSDESCRSHYVTIVDTSAGGRDVRLCGDRWQQHRLSHVYLSRSNEVRVRMTGQATRFMLRFDIIGCAEFSPLPLDSHLRYEMNRLLVVCNATGQQSILHCEHNAWKGTVSNCSASLSAPRLKAGMKMSDDKISFPPLDVSAMIVSSVAMIVVIYIASTVVCAIYIIRRRRMRTKSVYIRPPEGGAETASQSTFNSCHDVHGHVMTNRGQWHQLRQTVTSPSKLTPASTVWSHEIESCASTEQCHLVPSLQTTVDRSNCCQCCECGATCPSTLQHCGDSHPSIIFSVSGDAI